MFPDFNEIRKYTGVNKARNFEIFRDILRAEFVSNQLFFDILPSYSLISPPIHLRFMYISFYLKILTFEIKRDNNITVG